MQSGPIGCRKCDSQRGLFRFAGCTCALTLPRTDASFGITTRPAILRRSTEFLAVEAPSTGLAPPLLGAWFSSIPDTPSLDRCPATFFSRLGSTEFAWVVASVGRAVPKEVNLFNCLRGPSRGPQHSRLTRPAGIRLRVRKPG